MLSTAVGIVALVLARGTGGIVFGVLVISFAVAAAGKGRSPRTFERDVAPSAVAIDDFADQQRPTITQLRTEVPELMAAIWTIGRESMLVDDEIDRTTKEAVCAVTGLHKAL